MTEDNKDTAPPEDVTLTDDETLPSSLTVSLPDSSVRLKQTPKSVKNFQKTDENSETKNWWLKRPETRLGSSKKSDTRRNHSPEVTSSMREFLEKEKFCKTMQKSEGEVRDRDDTLCDILPSAVFDKYPSDFENATDEDIGSLLEEMSKIAGALSPNSVPERTKSGTSSKHQTEEEKSVEELLEEAEKLVRENSSLSKSSSRSETLIPSPDDSKNSRNSAKRLEDEIFRMIKDEVHKESEKNRKSPRTDRERAPSPEFSEFGNSLKPPTPLELQKKRFEEGKVEVSSSSDLDDPIERHSKSEDLKSSKMSEEDKVNLQKEITDVDKDFFENLLQKSKFRADGGISGSSSFGQEDFSHFLKILQGKSDQENPRNFMEQELMPSDPKNSVYPEKEISEILEKELSRIQSSRNSHEIDESEPSSRRSERKLSRNSSRDRSNKAEVRKVPNSDMELYTVGLTPRLELFADAIPKLIAEKSNEKSRGTPQEPTPPDDDRNIDGTSRENLAKIGGTSTDNFAKVDGTSDKNLAKVDNEFSLDKFSRTDGTPDDREILGMIPLNLYSKREPKSCMRTSKPPERRNMARTLGTSRSYDQLPKPVSSFRSSLDDVRKPKSPEGAKKQNLGSRTVTKNPRVPSKPLSNFASKAKLSLKPTVQKQPLTARRTPDIKQTLGGGDNRRNLTKNDFEVLYIEEKHKCSLMKDQIEAEAKLYKEQIASMRNSFEEELFSLKKQNIILQAKLDELSIKEASHRRVELPATKTETRVLLLEQELEKQESLIRTYEAENKKLMIENKKQQEELRNMELKQRTKEVPSVKNEVLKLNDVIKDLREEVLKLNMELGELREKNSDLVLKHDDAVQQNGLLQDELALFKEQLKTKDKFINDRLQVLRTEDMENRRKLEELRMELASKTEKLKMTTTDFEKFQQAIVPLEKELLELRVKEQNMQEKLQVAKSHVEREKVLTLKLKDQVILDNKKILDLNRQVREMERILKRKNPDSVSALILTAKSDDERINLEKIKLLEERVAFLEAELRAKERVGQEKLTELQTKFSEMKERYTSQVSELEDKLHESSSKFRRNSVDISTQTVPKTTENKSVEVRTAEVPRVPDKERNGKVNLKSQNPKEDAHLIATIRGLKLELSNKDKNIQKISKELQELQKTNRRLQKEREKLLNDRKNFRSTEPERNGTRGTRTETNDQNSNVCHNNGNVTNGQKLSGSSGKLYDPMQFSENSESSMVKRLNNENEILKEELEKMNKDFMALKTKRIHDLNLLQEEHEREVAELIKEYSVKFGDSKVVKLQGQINTQVAIISHLKEQIDKLEDYKEQVVVLKVEREHLETKVKILNEKVKYLSTPGTEQLQVLQDKITMLQQRHESREMTLQNLVRDLLRNKTLCRDCKGEKGKNRQLCYFRQELDHILGMLQEIANS